MISRAETGQALGLTHFFPLSHYGLELSSISKTNTKPCLSGLVEGGDLASLALSLPSDKHLVSPFYIFSVSFVFILSIVGFTTLLAPINAPCSSLSTLLVEFVFPWVLPLGQREETAVLDDLVPGSAGSPARAAATL